MKTKLGTRFFTEAHTLPESYSELLKSTGQGLSGSLYKLAGSKIVIIRFIELESMQCILCRAVAYVGVSVHTGSFAHVCYMHGLSAHVRWL